ncbi:hypothetical protein M422DRAFT_106464, partial [Sphaerobolus stellatus SS14]
PFELLEGVADNVDEPKDLFSLALTCKSLSELVIPNHLDYQIIQCSPADTRVWEHLIENRRLASRVK